MENRVPFYKMIVIDEDEIALEMVKGLFGDLYEMICFSSYKSAKVFLNSLDVLDLPDIILIDVVKQCKDISYQSNLQIDDGFEMIEYLKNHHLFSKIPLICQSNNYDCEMQEKCFNMGANDFVLKPYNKTIVNARISNAIKISLYQKQLESDLEYQVQKNQERKDKLSNNAIQVVNALASTIETNHLYTKGHSSRVAEFSVALAKKIRYPKNKLGFLRQAGLLHDIGKLGITHKILNKTDKLSDTEYYEVKIHTTLGYNILSSLEDFKIEKDIALHHHERWDGKGYPDGLEGKNISLEARIVAIADSFDVMKFGRCYQRPKTNDEIANEFEAMAGIQFDPKLAITFAQMVRNGEIDKIIKKHNI